MWPRLWMVSALCLHAAVAAADTVVLANGDELTGEIVEWAVDHLVIDHPQLGRMRLSLEQLEMDTGERPTPGFFGTTFLRGWSRTIDLGWNGKQGNTENSNLTLGSNFRYEDDWKRWRFRTRYFFNTSDGTTEDNNARVDLRRDWLFPGSRWFAFVAPSYQYDQFESWQHRTVLAAGPGFNLVNREAQSLDVRVGPVFTREFGERQQAQADALFALDYTWNITSQLVLSLSNQLFSEVNPNPGEFRNLTIGELRIRLTERPKLSLLLGAENEYETDIEPGDKANDLKYYVSLGLDF